jgi:hypothetical protein
MNSCSLLAFSFLKKEVARGGERPRVLSISFIFSFFTTLPLSHSGSPSVSIFYLFQRKENKFDLLTATLDHFARKLFQVFGMLPKYVDVDVAPVDQEECIF